MRHSSSPDVLFAAQLTALETQRADVVAQLETLDEAIEALRKLAKRGPRPQKRRPKWNSAQRKEVSRRMKAYWAARRAKKKQRSAKARISPLAAHTSAPASASTP